MHAFIYYRVSGTQASAAYACARSLQRELGERHAIAGELLRGARVVGGGEETWMEVYRDLAPGALEVIGALAAASGLAAHLVGDRHAECFEDFPLGQFDPAPCA